jgi:hypothetical protein
MTPQDSTGGAKANPEERQRGFGQDHRRDRQSDGRDEVRQEGRHHVAGDDAHLSRPVQARGGDEILLAQGDELATHLSSERAPADHRQDYRDQEIDHQRRQRGRDGGGQAHPEGDRRQRLQELDHPLDQVVGAPPT